MKKNVTKLIGVALLFGAIFTFAGCQDPFDDIGGGGSNQPPEPKVDMAVDGEGNEFEIDSCSIEFKDYSYSQYGSNKIVFAGKYTKDDFKVEVKDFFGSKTADVTNKADIYVNDVKMPDSGITFEHKKTYTIYAVYKGTYKEHKTYEYKDIFAAEEKDLVSTISASNMKTVEGFCVTSNNFGTYQYVTKTSEGKMNLIKRDASIGVKNSDFSIWVGSSVETAEKYSGEIMAYPFKSTDKIIVLAHEDETSLSSEKQYGVIPVTVYPLSEVSTVALGRASRYPTEGDLIKYDTWNFTNIYNSCGDYLNLIALGDAYGDGIIGRYYFTTDGKINDGVELYVYDNYEFTGALKAGFSSTSGSWNTQAGTYYVKAKVTKVNGVTLEKAWETPGPLKIGSSNSLYSVHKIEVAKKIE